jgi:hypothetical protein
MDAWFPDINARGEIIAGGGIHEIWFSDPAGAWHQLDEGAHPKFVNAAWAVFAHGSGSRLLNLRNGEVRDRAIGYTQYAGGGGRWAAFYQAAPIHLDLYQTVEATKPTWTLRNGGKPALSATGHFLYYDNFTGTSNRIIYDDQVIAIGAAVDLSVCDQGAVWTFATSVHGRRVWFWPLVGRAVDISVQTDELLPVITESPNGPWVITGTHDGTAARIAGEEWGYFRAGDLLNPAAVWIDGYVHVVGSTATGQPLAWIVDPRLPPRDLTKLTPRPDPGPRPPPVKPTVQIVSYPSTVTLGQPARCTVAIHGGPMDWLRWLDRPVGATVWHTDALTSDPTKLTHDYVFLSSGDRQIAARVEGPGGSDQTALARVIHVVPAGPAPRSDRVWFGPNIASVDLAELAVTPERWPIARAQIGAFTLYAQHFHDDIPQTGPNTCTALTQAGLFDLLRTSTLPINVEIGVIKDWDPDGTKSLDELAYVVERAHAVGVTIATMTMDEPLTGNTGASHVSLEAAADIVATFLATGEQYGIHVGWAEAWPHIPLLTQEAFLDLLADREQKPRFWFLDIDRRRAESEHKDIRNFILQAQAVGRQLGIPVGVYLVGYDYLTDPAYGADVRAWARDVHAIAPDLERLVVQSWARRGSGGAQDLPANLPETDPSSHTALVNAIVTRFGPAPPPVPPLVFPHATVYHAKG